MNQKSKHVTKHGVEKTPWTENDLNILKEFYPEYGYKRCQELLPQKTKRAIISQANRLGIVRSSTLRFKEEGLNKRRTAQYSDTIICFECQEELDVSNFRLRDTKNRPGHRCTVCKNCEKVRLSKLRSEPRRYLGTILSGIKSRDPQTNLDLDFLYDLLKKQNYECGLTKIKMTTLVGEGCIETNISVDRIDPLKNYTKDNVRLVCVWANRARCRLTDKDFFNFCLQVTKNF